MKESNAFLNLVVWGFISSSFRPFCKLVFTAGPVKIQCWPSCQYPTRTRSVQNIRYVLLCYSDKVGVVSFSPRFRYKIPKIARDVFIISSLDSLLDACFRGPEKCCITGNTGQSEGCGAQHQTLVDLKKEG